MKLIIISLILILASINAEKIIMFTLKYWKDNNCSSANPPVCTSEGLTLYKTLQYTFTAADKDSICINIPGEDPESMDPEGILYPHSVGLTAEATAATNWEDVVNNFCDTSVTPHQMSFTLFTDVECQAVDKSTEATITLDAFVNVDQDEYNYTEVITCDVVDASAYITTATVLLLALVFILF